MSIMGMIESSCFLFPFPICSGASRQAKAATSACLVGQAPFWTIGSFALRCAPETSGDFRRRKRSRAAAKPTENSRVLELVECFVLLAWIDSGRYRPVGEIGSREVIGATGFEPATFRS